MVPSIDPTRNPSQDPTADPSIDPTKEPSNRPSASPSELPTPAPTDADPQNIEIIITFKYVVSDNSNVSIEALEKYFKNITGDSLSQFIVQDDVECDHEIAHINVTIDTNSTARVRAIITVCDEEASENLQTQLLGEKGDDLSKDIVETANNDESPIDIDEETEIIIVVKSGNVEEKENDEDGINYYEQLYFTIAIIIAAAGVIISILGYIHAKWYKVNDYYTSNAILLAIFHILDLLSDIFLAIIISERINDSNHIYLILFICVLIFIIVPISVSFGQLLKQIDKHWWKNDNTKSWLISYSKILYLLSLFTGSSFTAVKVMNSNLFSLNIFSMDLNKNDLTRYQTKRIYSIVLIENLPQVILQCVYLLQIGDFDFIAISSMIFSLISIIVMIVSMMTEKKILNGAGHGKAEFDVTGSMILGKAHHYRNKTKGIRNSISSVLGLESEVIEVMRPTKIPSGLNISTNIHLNHIQSRDIDYKQLLTKCQQSGQLAEIIKNEWKLQSVPSVSKVRFKVLESKDRMKSQISLRVNSVQSDEDGEEFNELKEQIDHFLDILLIIVYNQYLLIEYDLNEYL